MLLISSSRLKQLNNLCQVCSNFFALAVGFSLAISTSATIICMLLAVFFNLAAGNWAQKLQLIFSSRVAVAFLLFFGVLALGLAYTSANYSAATLIWLKYLKFFLGIFLFGSFVEQKWRNAAILAFLGSMIITLLISYLFYFGLFKTSDLSITAEHVFKDHIQQNFLMAFTCYLCAEKLLNGVYHPHQQWWRLGYGILLILAVYNTLFVSTGRSGYVIFAILFGLFILQNFSWKKGLLYGLSACLVLNAAAFLFSSAYKTRTTAMVEQFSEYKNGQKSSSIGERLQFLKNSMRLIKANPIFGTGTGSFKTEYQKVVSSDELITSNPHNEYLNIMVQLGVLGLMILIYLYYVAWKDSYLLPADLKNIAQAVILSLAAGCLINSWLMDVTEGYFFVYFMILSFSALPKLPKKNSSFIHSHQDLLSGISSKKF